MPLLAADHLVDALRDIQLLHPNQLDELAREMPRFPEARSLAQHLMARGWLTAYQVNQLFLQRGPDLVLGSYVLLERLGEGARGQVFKARHRHMKRVVALKVIRKELLADADAVHRFYLEIQAASQLTHPNIIHAFDAGPVGPTHFLAMEYVKGTDLARLVQQLGPLSISQACSYVAQAALGLQHAFERGMVHRDIKPGNLFAARPPGVDVPATESDSSVEDTFTELTGLYQWGLIKLLDFGLARVSQRTEDPNQPLTQEGRLVGTPDFMAPEQAQDAHPVDIRADIYSLGCTFYYMLTGKVPFPGGSYTQKLDAHRWQDPAPAEQLRRDLPPELATLLRQMMAKQPDDRFQTPAEVAGALGDYLGVPLTGPVQSASSPLAESTPTDQDQTLVEKAPPVEPPPSRAARPRKNSRRWRLVVWGGAAVLVAGLLFLASQLFGSRPTAAPPTEAARENEGELEALIRRGQKGEGDPDELWQGFVTYPLRHPGAPETEIVRAWLPRLRSPLDRLSFRQIVPDERYPWQGTEVVGVLGQHRWRHWGLGVRCLAYSPEGNTIAMGTDSPHINFWDATTGKLLSPLRGHGGPVLALAYLAGGKQLISASADKTVKLWDLNNGSVVHTFGFKDQVLSLAVAPDGRMVAAGGLDKAVSILDLKEKKVRAAMTEHGAPVTCAAWSSDGQLLATSGPGASIKIWTPNDPSENRRSRRTLAGHKGGTNCLAFAPSGNLLASGGADHVVRFWDGGTGQPQKVLKNQPGVIRSLAFSSDGVTVASGGADATVRLWDMATGTERAVLGGNGSEIYTVAFAPNGQSLVAGTHLGMVRPWNLTPPTPAATLRGHTALVHAVSFSPDGRTLATGSWDRSIRLWDVLAGQERIVAKELPSVINCLTFSPDGNLLAASGRNERVVRVWDMAKLEKPKYTFQGHPGNVQCTAFSPDGKMLASGSLDKTVRFWSLITGKEIGQLPTGFEIHCLAFSPDSKSLATGHNDKVARVWDVESKQEKFHVKTTGVVLGVAFSPDGATFATCGDDKLVRWWDATTGRERGSHTEHQAPVRALAFTPDGQLLVSCGLDGRLVAWRLGGRALDARSWTLPGPIYGIAVGPDSRHVATGNANGTSYIYRLAPSPARVD